MIKPNDFTGELKAIEGEIKQAIDRVFNGGQFILGNEVSAFEEEFAAYIGSKYCIGVGNCLDGLFLILKALNIGPGDEVLLPSNTYIATVLAVTHVGATPVFVEPDIGTYNIDPLQIAQNITPATKAIMVVHLYGLCADMEPIGKIAEKHGLVLIEDAAQGHGATIKGRKAGNFGTAAAFSFYPTKNLGACGDGGCITTNNESIAIKIKLLRNYGSNRRYINEVAGYNSRLDELQAAILRVKLNYLGQWIEKRREATNAFRTLFADRGWIWPYEPEGFYHAYHQLVVRSENREEDMKELEALGFQCLIHYPIPPYKSDAYKQQYAGKTYPIADTISSSVFSLPLHGFMWNQTIGKK